MNLIAFAMLVQFTPLSEYDQGLLFVSKCPGWRPASQAEARSFHFLTGRKLAPEGQSIDLVTSSSK